MLLSPIIMPKSDIATDEALYFKGKYTRNNDNLILSSKGDVISFCTYFNCFSARKWFKYTNAKDVYLEIELKGKGTIQLVNSFAEPNSITSEIIEEKFIDANEKEIVRIPINIALSNVISFDVINESDNPLVIYNASYNDKTEEEQANYVRLAIGICTFKREKFILANLQRLKNAANDEKSPLFNNIDIYVSDNAGTLDISSLKDNSFHIFKNPNYGGAGGFTRALIEAIKDYSTKKFTNFIFMDDDIMLDARTVEKTYYLLRQLKPEYLDSIIGGAMFSMDDTYLQFENASKWFNRDFIFNLRDVDMRYKENVILNENEWDVNYNAWCYCAYPFSVLKTNNLPLPIFFHMDDIEFCLRNKMNVISMNGINVWHLYRKGLTNSKNQYYDVRNKIIMIAELEPRDLRKYVDNWMSIAFVNAFSYRYGFALNTYQAIIDFCKGIDFLKTEDTLKIHSKLIGDGSWRPATQEEIDKAHISKTGITRNYLNKKELFKRFILGKHKDLDIILYKDNESDAAGYNRIICVEPKTRMAIEYKRSLKMLVKVLLARRKARKMIDKSLFAATVSYHNRINEVQRLSFWNKYLNLNLKTKNENGLNVCFCSSDNNISSGAFNSMVVLASLLQERHNINPLIVLPGVGTGTELLKKYNLPFVIVDSKDWIIADDATKEMKDSKIHESIRMKNEFFDAYRKVFKEHNADIVHVNTSYHFASVEPALKEKIKVVWHLREFLEEDQNKVFIDKKYSHSLINRADKVIAISNSLYSKYENSFKNLTTIYNGIIVEKFFNENKTIFENETIEFLCVGAVAQYKGQHLLVEALCKLSDKGFKDFKVKFAGTYGGPYSDALIEMIRKHDLDDNFEFLGVSSSVESLYEEADVVFVGSKAEAFGRITVEGMMSGCLVLGANTAGTKEIIKDNETGLLFESGDSSSVCERIKEILKNKEKMKLIAKNSQKDAVSSFSAVKNADAIYKVYCEIMGRENE